MDIPVHNERDAVLPDLNDALATPWRFIWVFLLILTILVMRRPDAVYNPQFWAEDATVFFKQAFETPAASTLVRPLGGYFHLVPRVVALVTVLAVRPEQAPLMFNSVAII